MKDWIKNHISIFIRTFSATILIFSSIISYCQEDSFNWNDLVSWNGQTHWTKYMIIAPGYFGPNALPIPELKTGIIESSPYFECNLAGHYSNGDNTHNTFFRYYHPFGDKISVEVSFVPLEYYSINSNIRDERKIRNANPKGFAFGDIHFGTVIQLLKNHKRLPDITYAMYFRTVPGGKLADARFTDMPGYNFDITFGKDFSVNQETKSNWRWYASLGFYAWQTNLDDYLQNDAISGGCGILYKRNNIEIENIIAGYYGYISDKHEYVISLSDNPYYYDGDQPFIYKVRFSKKISKYSYNISFQQGLHDFNYSSFIIGLKYFPVYKL